VRAEIRKEEEEKKEDGPEMSPTGQRGENRTSSVQGKKPKPVQPLYKG